MMTREEIAAIDRECEEQHISQQDYLERHGIARHQYYRWKRRYREEDEQSLVPAGFVPMDDMQLYEAVRSGTSPDFEDNLQIMCAEDGGCDLIITNNTDHFRGYTDIPVLSPEEFVSRCSV